VEIAAVALAVVVGALIKSITGMGLPPVAIPVLALFVGPQDAIVIMTLSTVTTNSYLMWAYRDGASQAKNLWTMIAAGTVGAPIGVLFLTNIEGRYVALVLGISVLVYIAVSLWKPHLRLSDRAAKSAAAPVGLVGGILQGATGLSSVVLASYIHALGLTPRAFVFMLSTLFQVFALVQLIGFWVAGLYTPDIITASLVAAVPATAVLAFGTRLSFRISPVVFNRMVMAVLGLSAIKMLFDAVA